MNKAALAALIVVLGAGLIVAGIFFFNSEDAVAPTQQELDGVTEPAVVTYNLDEIALHNTASDCWTAIGGSVYDITSYIPQHPGGDQVLRACGTDGTTLFSSRTTESGEQIGSGTPHSTDAFSLLGPYFIGSLEI